MNIAHIPFPYFTTKKCFFGSTAKFQFWAASFRCRSFVSFCWKCQKALLGLLGQVARWSYIYMGRVPYAISSNSRLDETTVARQTFIFYAFLEPHPMWYWSDGWWLGPAWDNDFWWWNEVWEGSGRWFGDVSRALLFIAGMDSWTLDIYHITPTNTLINTLIMDWGMSEGWAVFVG